MGLGGEVTAKVAATRLAYCERALPTAVGVRREALEATAAACRQHLANHCGRCGRGIYASHSVTAGLGPVCAHKEDS